MRACNGRYEEVQQQLFMVDEKIAKWGLGKEMEEWAMAELGDDNKTVRDVPKSADILEALFKDEALEWNRIQAFTDVTFVKLARRILIRETENEIFLQDDHRTWDMGQWDKPKKKFHAFCSKHNDGARELIEETVITVFSKGAMKETKLTDDVAELPHCDVCLVYLHAETWTSGKQSERFAEEVRTAMSKEVPILLAHEMPMPSIPNSGWDKIAPLEEKTGGHDKGSGEKSKLGLVFGGAKTWKVSTALTCPRARRTCEFDSFFGYSSTPSDLISNGIYQSIAMTLKGGEWRLVSLKTLAMQLRGKSDDPESQTSNTIAGKHKAARVVQGMARKFASRRKAQQESAVHVIAKVGRGFLIRKRAKETQKAAVTIQSYARMLLALKRAQRGVRKQLMDAKMESAEVIQSHMRGMLSRRQTAKNRQIEQAQRQRLVRRNSTTSKSQSVQPEDALALLINFTQELNLSPVEKAAAEMAVKTIWDKMNAAPQSAKSGVANTALREKLLKLELSESEQALANALTSAAAEREAMAKAHKRETEAALAVMTKTYSKEMKEMESMHLWMHKVTLKAAVEAAREEGRNEGREEGKEEERAAAENRMEREAEIQAAAMAEALALSNSKLEEAMAEAKITNAEALAGEIESARQGVFAEAAAANAAAEAAAREEVRASMNAEMDIVKEQLKVLTARTTTLTGSLVEAEGMYEMAMEAIHEAGNRAARAEEDATRAKKEMVHARALAANNNLPPIAAPAAPEERGQHLQPSPATIRNAPSPAAIRNAQLASSTTEGYSEATIAPPPRASGPPSKAPNAGKMKAPANMAPLIPPPPTRNAPKASQSMQAGGSKGDAPPAACLIMPEKGSSGLVRPMSAQGASVRQVASLPRASTTQMARPASAAALPSRARQVRAAPPGVATGEPYRTTAAGALTGGARIEVARQRARSPAGEAWVSNSTIDPEHMLQSDCIQSYWDQRSHLQQSDEESELEPERQSYEEFELQAEEEAERYTEPFYDDNPRVERQYALAGSQSLSIISARRAAASKSPP